MLITIATRRACHLLEKLQKSKYCGEVPATKLAALQKVSFPSIGLLVTIVLFILPPEITLILFKSLFFFYLVHHHHHHLHHLLNHQPSYHLDHLDHHYVHLFPNQVLQSEFLNAVREVGSPVVLYYSLLVFVTGACLFCNTRHHCI